MVSQFQEQESFLQNSIFDSLYCDEERFDEDLECGFGSKDPGTEGFNKIEKNPCTFLSEHDLLWEDEELVTLLSKEKIEACLNYDEITLDGSLKALRNEGIKWMLRVIAHYGFAALTAVFAVNYYDRFISSPRFQKDKPWMSQLAAVSCLSLAAKVEETQVPLLVDLQVEESKYVFEARTIQRMELLVLSTLQWKMNPVTPLSFFDHIFRRFNLMTKLHCDFSKRCESIIISLITDCRLVNYLPSVVATAALIYAIKEIEPCDALDYQNQLINLLGITKEKFNDCHKLIMEIMAVDRGKLPLKRRYESIPNSPSGIIDAYFSSESSNDSWAHASSLSPSPEPWLKRSRAENQHSKLAPQRNHCCG